MRLRLAFVVSLALATHGCADCFSPYSGCCDEPEVLGGACGGTLVVGVPTRVWRAHHDCDVPSVYGYPVVASLRAEDPAVLEVAAVFDGGGKLFTVTAKSAGPAVLLARAPQGTREVRYRVTAVHPSTSDGGAVDGGLDAGSRCAEIPPE